MKIGVLGGIGPEATGLFYLKLIHQFQQEGLIAKNEDFPQIVINSIPAPELVFDTIDKKDLEVYKQGLKELDEMQLDVIVMVCNTIHLFYDELQSAITTPILDLREEVKKAVKENNKVVTVLGTPSTIDLGLYAFEGIQYVNPNKREQRQLSEAIYKLNKGIDKEQQLQIVRRIVNKKIAEGSELVILACTEFAVMLEQENIPKLNTVDLLVSAVIKKYKERIETAVI